MRTHKRLALLALLLALGLLGTLAWAQDPGQNPGCPNPHNPDCIGWNGQPDAPCCEYTTWYYCVTIAGWEVCMPYNWLCMRRSWACS